MIARGFRPVGWVAAVGAAALGCYMLSLRVAAERADLARLDARIVAAQPEHPLAADRVRHARPDPAARGMERRGAGARRAGRPASSSTGDVSLARFDIARSRRSRPSAEVRLASAETPRRARARRRAAPQRAVAAPAPRRARPRASRGAPAAERRPPPRRAAAAAAARRRRRTGARRARRDPAAPPPRRRRRRRSRAGRAHAGRSAAAPERAGRAARARRPGLLDERTLRDLARPSRAERGGGTRD